MMTTMSINGKVDVDSILFEAFKAGANVKPCDLRVDGGKTFAEAETVVERNFLRKFGFEVGA